MAQECDVTRCLSGSKWGLVEFPWSGHFVSFECIHVLRLHISESQFHLHCIPFLLHSYIEMESLYLESLPDPSFGLHFKKKKVKPITLSPSVMGKIEKWPIVLLNMLFSFLPWSLPIRTVCRSWSHTCDNNYAMVVRRVHTIKTCLLKYLDLLMRGRENVKANALRVLRLSIDSYKSLGYERLMVFLQWLTPIKQFHMISLHLTFSLDFETCDRMALAVAALIPIHIVTVELFFHSKCFFTEHGALAIARSVSETIGLQNVVVVFRGKKIVNHFDVYFPGDEVVQKCGKVMRGALPRKQRVWRTNSLFATTNYLKLYNDTPCLITNFDGVPLFQ